MFYKTLILITLILFSVSCSKKIDPVTGEEKVPELDANKRAREFAEKGGGLFGDITNKGFWWTSTLFDSSNSYARRLEYNLDTVVRYYESNKSGFSVRCVKN